MKKVTEEFICDTCGKQIVDGGIVGKKLPVRFLTEQTEGRPCKAYYTFTDQIDLCEECAYQAFRIDATGAMGYNDYAIRGASE